MALKANHPRNQHTTPQYLLRNFADSRGHVYVFDKATERVFPCSTRNVGAESHFYDFRDANGEAQTLEYFMGDVEDRAAGVLRNILERESLAGLTEEERTDLSIFVAVQQLRVPGARHWLRSFTVALRSELEQRGIDPGGVVPEMSEADVKLETLRQIGIAKESSQYIFDKVWVLNRAPPGTNFYISDNPVTQHNSTREKNSPGAGTGAASFGVEIYLPLSPTYSLLMYCRRAWRILAAAVDAPIPTDTREAIEIVNAVRTGSPITVDPPNVGHQNARQVNWASRFLISADGDFDFVRRMLRDYPTLKRPREVAIWGGVGS